MIRFIAKQFASSKKLRIILNNLEFGKTVVKTDLFKIRQNGFSDVNDPVFVLSTGRCGTAWLTSLLEKDPGLKLFHNPAPYLRVQGKLAYEVINKKGLTELEERLYHEMFLGAREELIKASVKADRRMIFTDSSATFFAPAIMKIFPKAKFIHLYRHPGEFVRSGLRRNWYRTEKEYELSKIQPLPESTYFNQWNAMDQLEQISWLWNETNENIESFLDTLPSGKVFKSNFNEWSVDSIQDLVNFVGSDISRKEIEQQLGVTVNAQKKGNTASFSDWSNEDKAKLRTICGPLSAKYGYSLEP